MLFSSLHLSLNNFLKLLNQTKYWCRQINGFRIAKVFIAFIVENFVAFQFARVAAKQLCFAGSRLQLIIRFFYFVRQIFKQAVQSKS